MTSASGLPQTWVPILEGEAAALASDAVTTVAEAIGIDASLPARNMGPGLAAGAAGIALFFEYLDRALPGAGYGEIAQQRLECAIDAIASSTQVAGLFGGFTGVSWVVEHLQSRATRRGDEEDPNEDIDAALLDHLLLTPWMYDYDLVGGLVGYGVYALERLPRPSAVACLDLIVRRLEEIAQPRPEGLAWHTPFHLLPEPNRPWFPYGDDNLGVAHGTPGVIALLARICASGVATGQVRTLLVRAVSWLLAQKLPKNKESVFPYGVGQDVEIRPARTAWCYGDLGIAVALLAAGRAAEEPAWEREALGLARTIAQRPPESCGVNDASLCHGAAGLGHLLNRLYQATGDPDLLGAARAWFGRALGYWEPGRGIGGFLAFTTPDNNPDKLVWQEDSGFLIGSAGVGLALLAAISGVEPVWDRMLLVSPLPEKSAL
jgi:lantibiotic modifying enzyme